jgi:catechol 2,3-dioxygenase-like lactoylglutathione lyase family enzyme
MSDLHVTQIDHVSVLITNAERNSRFYRDLLGPRVLHRTACRA